ncbi:MAG TPA: family 10 glycosylhydrolase, partial [bacterium]|nr:family 10 glycosylhydrolase [bacterium]
MRSGLGLTGTLIFITLFCTIAIASGEEPETRALWVTRWDYQSPADIAQIMENAAAAHFNTILFQVRGDGTVFYRSRIELWASELRNSNPGWDPLQVAIDQAHARRLKLQAWINVYPGWMGTKPPRIGNQLYNAHPDWFMVDRFGQRQPLNVQYVWLSPTHPEVTPYLLGLCEELYTTYAIDGIHLDYIRYPAPSFSYDRASLEVYRQETGGTPDRDETAWSQWRREAISRFIARLHTAMQIHNPTLVLSAAVLGNYPTGRRVYLQDSHEWLARGIIDAIYPMIYTRDDTLFRRQLLEHRYNDHNRHVYPGIYLGSARHLATQLRIARDAGCKGMALFSYELLFPNHTPDPDLNRILSENFASEVALAEQPWKRYAGDSQGPIVEQAYTLPDRVYAHSKFRIAAKITDPSGVYDDRTGSDGKGIYLLFDCDWPPNPANEVQMSKLKNYKDWYITDKAIKADDAGLDFRFRIHAWDNHEESAGHPKRNFGYSDVWSLSILARYQNFLARGTFGPVIESPCALATDDRGQIWVGALSAPAITILDRQGHPVSFSPIQYGTDKDLQSRPLGVISAIAFAPPNLICVLTEEEPRMIYRFHAGNGIPLPGIALDFPASGIDCDREGRFYLLEENSTRWHLLSPLGIELSGSPFGIDHGR